MTVKDLLQSAQFLVDADGNPQAVQLKIDQWEELVALMEKIETWEREWHRPFDAIRAVWETSSPAPAEDSLPDDDTLVDLVHQVRAELD